MASPLVSGRLRRWLPEPQLLEEPVIPVRWDPQPGPQQAFINCKAFEAVYGGARGGGKTDAVLGEFSMHASRWKAGARGLILRRARTDLVPTIDRAREIFAAAKAEWNGSRSRFEWPNGATLTFGYLQNDADAGRYQGHSYTRVYVEELTQFPSPRPVDRLKATLRSATGALCRFRATCNPGGPGHSWVKARYIDPGPYVETTENGLTRVFIPARVEDNPALLANDPTYVDRLRLSGSAELVRMWLEGDWDVVEGAFFDGWSPRNIVKPFPIPREWTRFRAFDWGYAAPFSVGWWAVAGDDTRVIDGAGIVAIIPRGAMVRYREWYGQGRGADGVRMEAEMVAQGILEREWEAGERVEWGVADPSIFARESGPTIAERLIMAGVVFSPADNTRVGRNGAVSGWDQMRARIRGRDGAPMLYVFETCRDFIRTVPAQQHDPSRPEDLDTNGEDHIADETRYACMARPLFPDAPPSSPKPTGSLATLDGWR